MNLDLFLNYIGLFSLGMNLKIFLEEIQLSYNLIFMFKPFLKKFHSFLSPLAEYRANFWLFEHFSWAMNLILTFWAIELRHEPDFRCLKKLIGL